MLNKSNPRFQAIQLLIESAVQEINAWAQEIELCEEVSISERPSDKAALLNWAMQMLEPEWANDCEAVIQPQQETPKFRGWPDSPYPAVTG